VELPKYVKSTTGGANKNVESAEDHTKSLHQAHYRIMVAEYFLGQNMLSVRHIHQLLNGRARNTSTITVYF